MLRECRYANFVGAYCDKNRDEPVSVYSRTGYVIFIMDVRHYGVPKLQSEISLSTVEAEHMALSISMRDLIPFIDQITELGTIFGNQSQTVKVHCTLFEDNNCVLELTTKPRY